MPCGKFKLLNNVVIVSATLSLSVLLIVIFTSPSILLNIPLFDPFSGLEKDKDGSVLEPPCNKTLPLVGKNISLSLDLSNPCNLCIDHKDRLTTPPPGV